MSDRKEGLRRTLCATMRDVAAAKPDETDSGAPREKLAGKMKASNFAVLIAFKPSLSNEVQSCFLWKDNKLGKLSGPTALIERDLQEEGYQETLADVRVVAIPFSARFRINIATKEKDCGTDFLVSGGVHVSIWAKTE